MGDAPGFPVFVAMLVCAGWAFVGELAVWGALAPLWWVGPLLAAMAVALVARWL
jgi:hypothetical protein